MLTLIMMAFGWLGTLTFALTLSYQITLLASRWRGWWWVAWMVWTLGMFLLGTQLLIGVYSR